MLLVFVPHRLCRLYAAGLRVDIITVQILYMYVVPTREREWESVECVCVCGERERERERERMKSVTFIYQCKMLPLQWRHLGRITSVTKILVSD